MNEPAVVRQLSEYLNERDYTFFIDSGSYGDLPDELADELGNCGTNTTITIGRRVPDVIGFTPDEDIFAMEAKGDDNLRKGIGQAAHYRQGVHKSYLAAEVSALDEFADTALSCGLGVIPAAESGVREAQVEEPVENVGATKLNRTRRALTVKTSRFEPDSSPIPSTTRPENALLPVIAIEKEGRNLTESELEAVYRDSPQGLSTVGHSATLAQTLRLVTKVRDEYQSTDVGKMAYLLLHGVVETLPNGYLELSSSQEDSIQEQMFRTIGKFKNEGQYQNRKLYTLSPELAAFLRNQYMTIADIRLLTHILAFHDDTRIELSRAMALIALESPDAFLGLFCGSGKEDDFRSLVEDENPTVDDRGFRENLLRVAGSNSLYNFLYQIWNVGILRDGTDAVHQNDDLVVDEYYLEWNRDSISRLGATI